MHPQFTFHALNDQGKDRAGKVAEAFDGLRSQLELLCPEGRELALVRTNLEIASFFAKKAVANAAENQA